MQVDEADHISAIPVEDLRPNPYQPRRVFAEDKLEELVASIREHGIIQPLIVRRSAVRGYDIVAGERRFRAAQRAGLKTVPAVVRDLSDAELMEIAIIENLQREDLNAMEVAEAYSRLMDKLGLTQEQVAQRVGQSRSHVANMLRLLQLPEAIREDVSRGTLSMGHARALLAVEDRHEQVRLAERTIREDFSVRKLEALVYPPKQLDAARKGKDVSRETSRTPQAARVQQYEEYMRTYLGTSVKIRPGKKRGTIEIEYFSLDDLDRIAGLLTTGDPQGGE